MPRKSASKVVVPEEPVEVIQNPNVTVVELWGVKYNQIFNPVDGTTHLEPLVE